MESEVKIINPLEIENWDQLISTNKDCSIFHSAAWAKVLYETYKYIPQYVAQIDQNKIKILIPIMEILSYLTGRRGISLPFTDYCDPIIEEGYLSENIIEKLLSIGKKSNWKYLEIRSSKYLIPEEESSSYYYGHILNLGKDENQIISTFNSSTKRNIKKAQRENLKIRISRSFESIQIYYKLHCLTRKRHGVPPQPLKFFKKIYDYIISKNYGITILASIDEIPIAGAVFFHFGEQAMYKYGASDFIYQKLRPNNLIMWEAIKWYIQNNYKLFCFGRTESENEGLRRFKSGWGTEENLYRYYKYNLKEDKFEKQEFNFTSASHFFFKTIPLSLSKAIGFYLYKHIG